MMGYWLWEIPFNLPNSPLPAVCVSIVLGPLCWGVTEGPVIKWFDIWMLPAVCESMALGTLCCAVTEGPVIIWSICMFPGVCESVVLGPLCWGVTEGPVIKWFDIWMFPAVWRDWLLYGLISRCWGVIEGPVIIWFIWMRPAVCESMVLGMLCLA